MALAIRDLYGDGSNEGQVQMLREYRRDGTKTFGGFHGVEFIIEGNPRGRV